MGGEHRCYGCDVLVGMEHAAGCPLAAKREHETGLPRVVVTEADALYDPRTGGAASAADVARDDGGLVLSAEESVWAWQALDVLAARDELRPGEARLRARLATMIGCSAEARVPVREAQGVYVVMTGLPGPGIRALVDEAVERTADDGKSDLLRAVLEAVGAGCEFVECERADGSGVGPSSGVDWEPYPERGGLWRLGPFLLP